MSKKELNEEALIEAISSNIDSNDPDARQKAEVIADILIHLATSGSEEEGSRGEGGGGEEGGKAGGEGEESNPQTAKEFAATAINRWYRPISRLPKG